MGSPTQAVHGPSYSSTRRRQIRYPLRTPVVYRWLDESGLQRRARGLTRDISEAGAYVVSSQCPPKGEFVQLTFKLLKLHEQQTPRKREHLEMGGEVVRIDFADVVGAAVGFAVRSKIPAPTRPTDELSQQRWTSDLAVGSLCN